MENEVSSSTNTQHPGAELDKQIRELCEAVHIEVNEFQHPGEQIDQKIEELFGYVKELNSRLMSPPRLNWDIEEKEDEDDNYDEINGDLRNEVEDEPYSPCIRRDLDQVQVEVHRAIRETQETLEKAIELGQDQIEQALQSGQECLHDALQQALEQLNEELTSSLKVTKQESDDGD